MLHEFFSSTSTSISELLSSRTMPKSFFTGTVEAPGFFTLASTLQEIDTSRSVAVNSNRSPSARISTLERIGSVVRVLTTFCTACSPLMICSLEMVRFIGPLIDYFISTVLFLLLAVNKANNQWCQVRDRHLCRKGDVKENR